MTTSLRDLAEDLADRYDTDLAAMREAIETYAGQINDDADLYDAGTEELTDAGVRVVSGAVAAWMNDGTTSSAIAELEDAQADVNRHDEQIARRDAAVRAAIKATVPVVRIAEMTGLTRGRIYQIRDSRR